VRVTINVATMLAAASQSRPRWSRSRETHPHYHPSQPQVIGMCPCGAGSRWTVPLEAGGNLPLGEPLPTGPEVPKKEIHPLPGIKGCVLRVLGSPPTLLCYLEVRPSGLGAAGPCRTIRSVLWG
jgi:hypothetical protein